jgi:DNA-binding response OmpR family regulator
MSTTLHTPRIVVPGAALSASLDFATAKKQLTGHRALVMEEQAESFGRMFLSLSSAGCPATLVRRWAQIEPMARRTRPTLVLFSTQLAEMSAEEIVHRMRENPATRAAILVALAARESKKERRKLLDLGCDGYVWKPADRYLFAMDLVARTPALLQSGVGADSLASNA